MKTKILFLTALLLAAPAWSANSAWSGNCQFSGGDTAGTIGTPVSTETRVGTGNIGCLRFNNTASTFNSAIFTVAAESAVIAFDPDLAGPVTVATTALVIPHYCPTGKITTAANPEYDCLAIGGAGTASALDGVEGPAGSQNAAIRVGPGVYYIQVFGACLANKTCQVSVKGEGAK